MLLMRQLLHSIRGLWISRADGTAGAGACSYLQQLAQPVWQQAGVQLPPQHAPQAVFSCEVCATAVTARTTTSESNAIVRFMIYLL